MELQKVLHMNGGEGEVSYANNSTLQKIVISKVLPVLGESVKDIFQTNYFHPCLRIADLGCSSGPNTLLVITDIIETIYKICCSWNRPSPGFQVFLNDLPGNDFNSIFRSLPSFYEKINNKGDELEPCFINAISGSFYGRLFPCNSLHLVHSSYSLHFLSQLPRGLEPEAGGIPLNKGNIYISKTSSLTVRQADQRQFKQDLTMFLTFRSIELIPRGHMVLTFMGRRNDDPSSIDEHCTPWNLLALALNDMVLEGLLDESKLDSFNMPYYAASANEIKELIKAQGSFELTRFEVFEISWDGSTQDPNGKYMFDVLKRAKNIANCIRAVAEPMLVNHFGEAIMEDLFNRFIVKVTELLMEEEAKYVNLVLLNKQINEDDVCKMYHKL